MNAGAAASPSESLYRALTRVIVGPLDPGVEAEMLAVLRDWNAAPDRPGMLVFWSLVVRDLFAMRRARGSGLPPRLRDRESMVQRLLKDLSYALRGLRRAPAFTATVVLTLALGIGANTAIFSVVDGILLRPLAFEDPDQLIAIWADMSRRDGPEREWLSYPNFLDARELRDVFAEAGTYLGYGPTLTGAGEAVALQGAAVNASMFADVLRVQPAVGRGFLPSDDQPGAEAVVLLSWELWQRQWQGDPAILGEAITLSGEPATVIGVMPARFQPPFAPQAEIWTTLRMNATDHAGVRGSAMYRAIGRLQPDVTLTAARSATDALAARLEAEYPGANAGVGYSLYPLRDDLVGPTTTALWALLGSVGVVLLMACVNIANLLLTQASARGGELAVRAALGATRGSIVRQLLTESLVLATGGGLLGLAVGVLGTRGLVRLAPPGTPRIEEVVVDARVLAFAAVATIVAALVFGLLPALRVSRGNLAASMHDAGRTADGSGGRGLRSGLVVAQVALAVVLLVGAGLLLRTFQQLQAVDLGFQSDGVLAMQLGLPSARYPDPADRVTFYTELERRLAALPGVEAVGGINSVPMMGNDGDANFQIEGRAEPPPGEERIAWIRRVTPSYPDAMGLRLVAGRFFEPGDDGEASPVVVINETLAERYFADRDPIGQRIYFGRIDDDPTYRTIIGVAGDVKNFGVTAGGRNAIYFPFAQLPSGFMSMLLRTDQDPSLLAAPARAVVAEMDDLLAMANITTMNDVVDQSLAAERFTTTLMGAFAAVALVLAVVGLYGVVSYGVTQRSHEIGVRLALGARATDIGRQVVGGSVTLVAIGLGLGLVGAWWATRALAGLLFQVEPTDPLTFTAVVGVLAIAGIAAASLPARRATRVDPIRVLGTD